MKPPAVLSEDQTTAWSLATMGLLPLMQSLADLVMQGINRSPLPGSFRLFVVVHSPTLLGLFGCLAAVIAAPLGRHKFLPMLVGSGMTILLMYNFRGQWTWGGTMDYYRESSAPWQIGLGLGVGVGLLLPAKFARGLGKVDLFLYVQIALGVLVLMHWLAGVIAPVESLMAPTRAVGLLVVQLTLLVLSYILKAQS
jgi:hypothetical protein